jgi:predicted secreted protein
LQVARIGGRGIFTDELSEKAVRDYFSSGVVMDWQVVIPDQGTVEGLFEVSALEPADAKGSKPGFQISLRAAGKLRITAARVLVESPKL